MTNDFTSNYIQLHQCEFCDFSCSKIGDWKRHILTGKHKKNKNTKNTNKTTNNFTSITSNGKPCKKYNCICGRAYMHASSLWNHKQKCTFKKEDAENEEDAEDVEDEENVENISTEVIIELLKQNQEFKQLIVEQNKQMLELASKTNSITNNNTMNNNFNLSVFLNETCKDAMNLTDFVNSLTLTLKDLEDTGKLGYEEGISKIFINGLNELDVSKRPIHCTDVKREKLYIRDSNIWEKDQEQEHLRKAVRKVANQNVNQIIDWIKANPESQNYDSKKNDQYLQIVIKSTGGSTKEEEEKRIGKVITNIAKHVEIDKTSKNV
jgi:hypothetical protein